MNKATTCAALCALGLILAANARATEVVVSIKPVHSLVAGVMGDTGDPWLMLTGTASPHTYQMRPSEAEALAGADLVVWVGENMETFLDRPIANLGSGAEILTLHEAPGMKLLPSREGGIWSDEDPEHHDEHMEHEEEHSEHHDEEHEGHEAHEAHEDEHAEHEHGHDDEEHKDEHAEHGEEHSGHDDEHAEHEHEGEEHGEHDDEHENQHEEHGHGHAHGEFDLHIWLDPGNARLIVEAVADALVRIDPLRVETYRANADSMRMRIDELESSLRAQLAPVRERAFIVFHDGYHYFEDAFGPERHGGDRGGPGPPAQRQAAHRAARRAGRARRPLRVHRAAVRAGSRPDRD